MPLEFWLSALAQLAALVGVALRLEHRITRLEADVRWLINSRHHRLERHTDPH